MTDPKALETSPDSELNIKIKFDKDTRILTLTDNGVGMSKAELSKYLGTIAYSGTKNFLEKVDNEKSSSDLIGQFGVGFYSAFLVADTVEVTSKSNDDPTQHVWISTSKGSYQIYADPDGNTLGRGTRISLSIREDAQEFLEVARIKNLVQKYSEFINFPIYLWTTKEVEEEEPVEAEAKDAADDDGTVKEVDEEEEKKEKKTKKVKKTVTDWERMNESRPVWTRNPKDVKDEDYFAFYKSITKDYQDPMNHVHFIAEGELEFRSILFVPKDPPRDMFDAEAPKANIKLYVRRVFIKDEDLDLLPRYLNFIRGVIDSNDLPLNVSREMLQQSKTLKVIRKKLVRKALEMFKEMADASEAAAKEEPEDEKEKEEKKKIAGKYLEFWKGYGKNIKLGLIEDSANKSKLSKLLRFQTSKSGDDQISLDTYIANMKEGQDVIYYLAGESKEHIEASPFIGKLKKNDLEVIYFLDPIDEYAAQTLTEYDGKKLQNIGKEGQIKFSSDSTEEEMTAKKVKAYEERYKSLCDFVKNQMTYSKLSKVVVSDRLTDSPAVLVAGKHSYSAAMERVVKSQALQSGQAYTGAAKIMEINPRHPVIKRIDELITNEPKSERTVEAVNLLYDAALLTSGYTVREKLGMIDKK